jgi:hypothetical protein
MLRDVVSRYLFGFEEADEMEKVDGKNLVYEI